jgi:hypothetical protein
VDEAMFWSLIDKFDWKRAGDDDRVVKPAITALAKMSEGDISEFQSILASKLYALDGRAWARQCGEFIWWGEPDSLSVDGFLYARCVVVANGKGLFDAVLADPKQMPADMEFEKLLYVARAALKMKTGQQDAEPAEPTVSFETFSNRDGWS